MKKTICGLIMLLVSTIPAAAGCNFTAAALSRALFANSGSFASLGPASILILDCENVEGAYAQFLGIVPLRKFDTGKEIDLRAGWRGKIGDIKLDMSAASYNYTFGTGKRDWSTDMNGRLRVSYDFGVGIYTISPYVGVDLKRSINLRADDHSIFGGLVSLVRLTYRLSWNSDLALWYHFHSPIKNYRPAVFSITTGPQFMITEKQSIAVNAIFTHGGDIDHGRNKGAVRLMFNSRF